VDLTKAFSAGAAATPYGAAFGAAADVLKQGPQSGISGATSAGGALTKGDFIVGGFGRNQSPATQWILYGVIALVAIAVLMRR
jgi:hypothetical protein